jgi:cobalamin synthase
MNRSQRGRAADAVVLLAISLASLAGVNVSDRTRDALLVLIGVSCVVLLWLFWTMREDEPPTAGGRGRGRGRVPALATASIAAWGGLGLAVAADLWPLAVVAALAAAVVTWAIVRRV